ncbi:hypothetical protein PILCRDRAFT_8442 [Piloderma croceum F 1598]|uniref:Uncharacterized protein n=1 Tax=Piloderma croceum (strain F 1598) TaxID=765440 RepID=A0A0C3B6A2_PILCF|nr:hypothetical protein PILCRDRAFT_8442 [Piloderma croceum F 1598]
MKDAFPRSWCVATSPFLRASVSAETERERTDVVMMSLGSETINRPGSTRPMVRTIPDRSFTSRLKRLWKGTDVYDSIKQQRKPRTEDADNDFSFTETPLTPPQTRQPPQFP